MSVNHQPKAQMPAAKYVIDPGASQGARRATEDAPGSTPRNSQAVTDPEVVAHAQRRNFSPAQKRRILDEADRCTPPPTRLCAQHGHTLAGASTAAELATARQVRRNCLRGTDRGKQAWSVSCEPRLAAGVGERGRKTEARVAPQKWRQAIEPMIGHTKADHRMDRCWLQGELGDGLLALSCVAGYNIRWLMRAIARVGISGLLFALAVVIAYLGGSLRALRPPDEFCRAD